MWTGNNYQVNISLIRHGATASNVSHKYISITDEELSEEGRKSLLEKYPPRLLLNKEGEENSINAGQIILAEKVYISPMTRCRQTAQIIFGENDFTEISEFTEMNFGIFEGKNFQDLKDNEEYRKWVDSGCEIAVRQGEKKSDFVDRVAKGLIKVLADSKDLSDIAIVCHGGTIMAIQERFAKLPFYENMPANGQRINCTAVFNVDGEGNVKISSFSIVNRDNC